MSHPIAKIIDYGHTNISHQNFSTYLLPGFYLTSPLYCINQFYPFGASMRLWSLATDNNHPHLKQWVLHMMPLDRLSHSTRL